MACRGGNVQRPAVAPSGTHTGAGGQPSCLMALTQKLNTSRFSAHPSPPSPAYTFPSPVAVHTHLGQQAVHGGPRCRAARLEVPARIAPANALCRRNGQHALKRRLPAASCHRHAHAPQITAQERDGEVHGGWVVCVSVMSHRLGGSRHRLLGEPVMPCALAAHSFSPTQPNKHTCLKYMANGLFGLTTIELTRTLKRGRQQ